MQSKDVNSLSILETVLADLNIPYCDLFWDENVFGKKPKTFAVYSFENDGAADLSSDDETEVAYDDLTVSFYVRLNLKNNHEFRQLKTKCKNVLYTAGFFVADGYETYEKDTGLKRFDLRLNYFYSESED